jgi:predicted nuclease of restriction endonuclease-like (RecB) superfamily
MMEFTAYWELVEKLKLEIRESRLQAMISVNAQMLQLYWKIGQAIVLQQQQEGWGTKVIDRLAADLKKEFSDMKGISPRNLKYMRSFAEAWPQFVQVPLAQINGGTGPIVQGLLAQITWYHHITILDKVKTEQERLFYIQKTRENGWSRNVLVHQIESRLYERQGKLQHNFALALPSAQGDLVREVFKDPYKFDFLQLTAEAQERDLENALVDHITKFLLEMGKGFSYVGRQVHLEKGGQDYYIDLLLYHYKLHCFVVIELKIGEFKPEYAGKMNFYLSAVDEDLRTPADKPSIGLILCKSKNRVTVEYALRDLSKPMGVAEYDITAAVPQELKGELPTIEALEQELEKEIKPPEKPINLKVKKLKDLLSALNKEEVQKGKDKEAILQLFNKVLPALEDKITRCLEEVVPLFHDFTLTKRINHTSKPGYANVDLEAILERENVDLLGLTLRLEGFKKASTQAFGVYKDLIFTLQPYKYSVGPERDNLWEERLYHQEWSDLDLQEIAEKWSEEIVEEITKRLENINGSN